MLCIISFAVQGECQGHLLRSEELCTVPAYISKYGHEILKKHVYLPHLTEHLLAL